MSAGGSGTTKGVQYGGNGRGEEEDAGRTTNDVMMMVSIALFLSLLCFFAGVRQSNARRSSGGGNSNQQLLRRLLLLPRKTKITWVNGIAHRPEDMLDPTLVISTAFGNARVDYCHNPSSMTSDADYVGFMRDAFEARTNQMGRITPEVDALVGHIRRALACVGGTGRVIHISHSQGSAITWLAAKRLTDDERSRIEIITFGGAATIGTSEFPTFARCINYYAISDPILNVVPSAVKALNSGFSFGSRVEEQEIIFLASRTGDPVTDHGLLNPTYLDALLWEGRRYQSLYMHVPLWYQLLYGTLVSPVWFSNFAYEITRQSIIAIIRLVIIVYEFIYNIVHRVVSLYYEQQQDKYESVVVPSIVSITKEEL